VYHQDHKIIKFDTICHDFKEVSREFSRREKRRFRSDDFLDLHGYNRDIAAALKRFCITNIIAQHKMVTVITGKGSGVLKQAAADWLKDHPQFVSGFFEIKDTRGESGVYGVFLRTKLI
jgi:DNA-nicking Smr family endonuclease